MRFVIIKPKIREVSAISSNSLEQALRAAGLDPKSVDHGMLARHVAYVVHEFGLFVPAAQQSYFGIAGRLVAGSAVLYGVGDHGETIDLLRSQIPDVQFYLGVNDVEAAIYREEVARPFMALNGETFWEWPAPAPEGYSK